MTDSSFAYMATVKASTKRPSSLSSGPVTNLTNLKCIPRAPVDTVTRQRPDLQTPHMLYETFFQGNPDIKKGDLLVIDSVDYPVKNVEPWPWGTDTRLRVFFEDLRN